MTNRQKEVLKKSLNDEEDMLKSLKKIYQKAASDCAKKIAELSAKNDMENLQSIIYQKQYQEALKNQIDATLDQLQSDSFIGISDYMQKCYENGYIGAMYDLHGQDIPLIMPIDQKQVIQALQIDSKISKGLYNRLGEDTDILKKSIRREISRGVVTGLTYNQIATNIAYGMNTPFKKAKNNAMRIARTEGHRVQLQATSNAQYEAKAKGADIVKQWDSTLDGRTRESHQKVDGEIRELDEKFSNGLRFPGDPHGAAAEVVNCRCALLQRARSALDKNELRTLKKRAKFFKLDKTANFEDFKEKYLNIPKKILEEHFERDIISLNLQFFANKSKHAEEREIERNISEFAINDALENPLFKSDVVVDELGRKSVKYIGKEATVIINPDTNTEITTWKTSSRIRKKYESGD